MWLVLLIIAIIVGAIWGASTSDEGEAGAGAVAGGMGCGYVLFRIFLFGLGIMAVIWLFGALFG